MEMVLNRCYGSFDISDWAQGVLGLDSKWEIERTDPRLITLVKKYRDAVNGKCANLRVVEIPDEATDWELMEYDGMETVIYVVDGKLHRT